MGNKKRMRATCFDGKNSIRLTGYADTMVWAEKPRPTLIALRFGGYPEEVRGLADAIYGGVTIEIAAGDSTLSLNTLPRGYRRELGRDGVYAEATLIAEDDANAGKDENTGNPQNAGDEAQIAQDLPPAT